MEVVSPASAWYSLAVRDTNSSLLLFLAPAHRPRLSSLNIVAWLRVPLAVVLFTLLPATVQATIEPPPESSRQILEAAFQFARAKLLADEGSFEKAQKAYERALELDGSDPYSRIELAKFHSYLAQISRSADKRLDNLRKAAGYAGEARRMAEDNLEILSSYAQIQLRLGEHQLAALDLAQGAYEELRRETEGDLQVLISLGQIYLWKQEADKAVEVLEEAASYLPNHRMVQTMLLDSLLETGRHREAEDVVRQLISIEPTSIEHRMKLAELQSERGAHSAAVATLSAAPEQMLSSPRLRRVLAQELHLSGDNGAALALTDELRAELPGGSGLNRLRVAILSSLTRYEEAVAELEQLLAAESDGGRLLQGSLHLSRLLERVGNGERAAEVLRKLITDQEDQAGQLQLKLALSGVLERQERMDEAVSLLRREVASSGNAELPSLSLALADLLVRADRTQEALELLDQTSSKLAGDPEAAQTVQSLKLRRVAVLGAAEEWEVLLDELPSLFASSSREIRSTARIFYIDALAALGRVEEALQELQSGDLEIDPQRRVAKQAQLLFEAGDEAAATDLLAGISSAGATEDLFLIAQVYQRVERYAESIPALEQILSKDDDSQQALFLLGAAHERSGDRGSAVETFQRLLDLAPDHTPTLNYLGYMWAEVGENLEEAVALILRAVALEPDNGAYVDSLGWAYFQLGRYEDARRHLEWAARLVPNDATIFEHLGDLYVALDNIARARSLYRQALDLSEADIDTLRRKLENLDEKDL